MRPSHCVIVFHNYYIVEFSLVPTGIIYFNWIVRLHSNLYDSTLMIQLPMNCLTMKLDVLTSVLETVAILDQSVVTALIPVLSQNLRTTETKRGLGRNTTLRYRPDCDACSTDRHSPNIHSHTAPTNSTDLTLIHTATTSSTALTFIHTALTNGTAQTLIHTALTNSTAQTLIHTALTNSTAQTLFHTAQPKHSFTHSTDKRHSP